MKRKGNPVGTLVLTILFMLQTLFGPVLLPAAHAAGAEITENILKNLKVTITDQHQSVTVSVYDDPQVALLNIDWEQNAKVRLDYDWALPNGHAYTAGDTFRFQLPEQFKLFSGSLNFPLETGEGSVGSFVVNHLTNQAVMTFNNQIEELENIQGSLWFEAEFDKTKFHNDVTQQIVFDVKGNTFFAFTMHFKPNVGSTIEKKGSAKPGSYNAKTIDWTVDVNKVTDVVYGAVVTDELPDGLTLVPNSMKVFELDVKLDGTVIQGAEVNPNDYTIGKTAGNKDFTVTLGNIAKAYRVAYSTDIVDLQKLTFNNTATFSHNGNPSGVSSTAPVTVQRGSHLAKKSSEYDRETQRITWEIEYNYDETEVTVPELIDLFNTSQELVPGTIQVFPVTLNGSGNATNGAPLTANTHYTVDPIAENDPEAEENLHGFKLTFANAPIQSAYKIIYQTRSIDPVKEPVTISNKVTELNHGPGVVGTRPIQPLVIENACGPIDYAAQTIGWEIKLHGGINDLPAGVKLSNMPGANLELLPGTLEIRDAGNTIVNPSVYQVVYNPGLNEPFTITFSNPIADKYTVVYKTKYVDLAGGITSFTNQAKVEWTGHEAYNSTYKSVTRNCSPVANVQNNGFKKGQYNVQNKEVTWEVGVNYNSMNIPDAIITDELLQGQKLVANSIEIYPMTIQSNGAYAVDKSNPVAGLTNNSTDTKVDIGLGPISTPYFLTFKTTYNGALINDSKIYNAGKLMNGSVQVGKDLTADVTVPHGGEYVFKSGTQNGSNIKWTVHINRGLSYVQQARVVDKPSANQLLLENTFKLYATSIAANGTVTKGAELPASAYELKIQTDTQTGTQTFELKFNQPIDTAYILEYESLIDAAHGEVVSNEIVFKGENAVEVTKSVEDEVVVSFSSGGGTGSGINRKLTVIKVDVDNAALKLPGATFKLERLKGSIWEDRGTKTTNASGEVVFDKLLSGTYRLTETASPAGYVLNAIPLNFTVLLSDGDKTLKVENGKVPLPADRKLTIEKVDEDNAALKLAGASFKLKRLAGGTWTDVAVGTTNASGKWLFDQLQPGDYRVTETAAPAGYVLNASPVNVTITNSDKDIVVGNKKIVVAPMTYKLTVVKVKKDDPAFKLAGASFKLERRINGTWTEFAVGTTNTNGELLFDNLLPSEYRVTETAAPVGYVLTASPFHVTVTNSDIGIVVENEEKKEPTTPTTPTTPTSPAEPTDSTDTTDPTKPTAPTDSVSPTKPTTPTDSAKPTIPADPTKPVEPTDSKTPMESPKPTDQPASEEESNETHTNPAEDTPVGENVGLAENESNVKDLAVSTTDQPGEESGKSNVLPSSQGGKPAMLPKTGESSPIIPNVIGGLLIFIGLVIFLRRKSGRLV
ncbi:collagen binding domain-containing protein [Paenibacillus sp. GD4]|uniref:collagen binding domain-containing protein n=1 Tax=Paenibacillus sp. GD4 TaxID=3068890 RepID=UPI00279649CC|nr:collagen binding domain-containing protein [Paenibacillus sp. GD4]MDQ1913694.1 collagen binding domain-containing protein [Paenibacillus sp. GD4]